MLQNVVFLASEPDHPHLSAADQRTVPGQLLWPQHYGPDEIAQLKRTLGSYATAGQLQQRPAPAGGGIFKREWWNWYDPTQPLAAFDQIVQSWDLAFSDGLRSDYVVGQAWGRSGPQRYLLHQIRDRLSFTDTLGAIREMTAWVENQFPRQRGHAILVERAANAAAAIDVLRRELTGVIGIDPEGNKLTRAHAVAPQIEARQVWLPGAPNETHTGYDRTSTPQWVQEFVTETESFPNGAHDDQVDAMCYALRRFARPQTRVRVLSARGVHK